MNPAAYPYGFLFAEGARPVPGWRACAIFPGLSVSPELPYAAARSFSARLVVLGTCLPVDRRVGPDYDPAADLLASLRRGTDRLFERLGVMAGRYVVFHQRRPPLTPRLLFPDEGPFVAHDATGLRAVFHAPGVVASHAVLIHRALGSDAAPDPMPHQWGWPGDRTPWPEVRLLTPNQSLDVATGALARFYPTRRPGPLGVEEAAEATARMVKTALANFAARHGALRLGLTAGVDSRTSLALAAGATIDTFTFVHDRPARIDAAVAAELAARAGVPHFTLPVPRTPPPPERRALYEEATYYRATWRVVEAMRAHAERWPTFLSSNLLEIGRAFYANREKRLRRPSSPVKAAQIYNHFTSVRQDTAIEAYGRDAFKAKVREAFADFYERAALKQAFEVYDPFDVLYWEHRMPAWHGNLVLVRDFVCDTFVPFNARAVFETLLRIDAADRADSTVFRRLIERESPALAALPFNPSRWPSEAGEGGAPRARPDAPPAR